LAQFKPNGHRFAERNIVWQGFQSYLPMQEETRRLWGKFTTRMRRLFSGYLFVAFGKERVRDPSRVRCAEEDSMSGT
jgi:transcriptional antiterminator RfaH